MIEEEDCGEPGRDDPAPTVIVYGTERHDAARFRAQVDLALKQAGLDCAVLEAGDAPSAGARGRAGIHAAEVARRSPVRYSLVLPILNEEGNIPELYRRLKAVMDELGESYELVFVDDGSRDRSLELMRELQRQDPEHVCAVVLSRNFGHQRAVSAGLDYARGQAVIVMDADLQDPPEVLPQFVGKWQEGFQVVYAVREKRKESWLKRAAYRSFYLVLRSVSRIDIPLDSGDFCLMDRCVVDAVTSLPERNRFVRGLRSWVGFRQLGLAYERDARHAGKPKYSFRRLVSLALDGMISFSYLPLRLATLLGFGVSALSLMAATYYVIKRLTVGIGPAGFATLVVLMSFLGGVQLITIGVIGEYIGHVLDEVKGRPTYVVREVLRQHPATMKEEAPNANPAHSDPG
jgi:glycosyltransferase involved in cell wall biosynthesis